MMNPCSIVFTLLLVFPLVLLAAVNRIRFINIPAIISRKKKATPVMAEKRRT